jgi:hypothetical protein
MQSCPSALTCIGSWEGDAVRLNRAEHCNPRAAWSNAGLISAGIRRRFLAKCGEAVVKCFPVYVKDFPESGLPVSPSFFQNPYLTALLFH